MNISGLKIGKILSLKTKLKILLGICSPMFLLLILGAVSAYSINTIVETNERVDHTHVVLGDAAAIVASAVDIARNVQEAAKGTQEVSSNIAGVTQGAGETGRAAASVLEATAQLARQSEDLRAAVDKFLVDIRAA